MNYWGYKYDDQKDITYITIDDDGVAKVVNSRKDLNPRYDTFYISSCATDETLSFAISATDEELAQRLALYFTEHRAELID